jgi:hypothetical protein
LVATPSEAFCLLFGALEKQVRIWETGRVITAEVATTQSRVWGKDIPSCLPSPFLCLLRCCSFWRNANLVGGFACRLLWCVFLVSFMICRVIIMEPRSFMIFCSLTNAPEMTQQQQQCPIGLELNRRQEHQVWDLADIRTLAVRL